ncbi:MAG TPA: hypothetical protein PLV78_10640 [Deltaproteobacteria bacterium]|nr:hypothetical protein [Deltaproteobacteria bacterium]
MPRGDGTGPLRLRIQGGGMRFIRTVGATTRRPIHRSILGLGLPLVAALINDIRQPDGYLRPLLNHLIHRRPTVRLIETQQASGEDTSGKIEKTQAYIEHPHGEGERKPK